MLLTQVDEVNDSLTKQVQKEAKGTRQAINIAFFDISTMSSGMQAVYLAGIFSAIGLLMF